MLPGVKSILLNKPPRAYSIIYGTDIDIGMDIVATEKNECIRKMYLYFFSEIFFLEKNWLNVFVGEK